MKPHHYVAIFVRLFSIGLFVFAMRYLHFAVELFQLDDVQRLQFFLIQTVPNFVVPVCIGVILWRFPILVAKSIVKPEIEQEIEAVSRQGIGSIVIAAGGLFVFFYAIIDAVYYLALWQFAHSPDIDIYIQDVFNAETRANVWATGIELILGCFITFKSKAISSRLCAISS